jgi:hypothetical protein
MYESKTRACGKRLAAGVYAETRLSPFGEAVETFILCPPKPIEIAAWGLAPHGARLFDIVGVGHPPDTRRGWHPPEKRRGWHIFDIVSKTDYQVADYIEETRCKGASRRLSRMLDFSKLGEESRLVLIHERAIIENTNAYPQPPAVCCPREVHLAQLDEMCAGLWWHDFRPDELQSDTDGLLRHIRTIPGGVSYIAHPRPEGVEPIYHYGIFMSLPITNLAVIAGRNPQEEEKAEKAFQAASLGGLPVFMEDE